MKSTRCFNPHPRWQEYRTSWPTKDATGDSSHHVDLTLEEGAAATSMKYDVRKTPSFLMPP